MHRRDALISLAALSLAAPAVAPSSQAQGEGLSPFTGSWHVTSAVTSIVLSIEPQGEALVLTIENGAHSLERRPWRKLEGGLVVDGVPMFRVWQGRNAEELRVEMEPLPEEIEVGGGLRQFPRGFFMRRASLAPRDKVGRPLPQGWDKAVLSPDWDQKAGRRRPSK